MPRFTSLLATAGALALLAVPAAGQTAPTVTRFPASGLPDGSTCPGFTAPVQARDGNMWFFGVNFAQPFRISPLAELVTLPPAADASCIREAAAATDGNIWAGTFGDESLVRFAPDGTATRFAEGPNVTDVVAADDGNVWATDFENGLLGRMTTGGTFTAFPVGQPQGGLGAIAAGPDGNVWFTRTGGIGRVTSAGVVTEFNGEGLTPRDLTAGPDGNLWIVQDAGQPLVRRTLDGTITPFSDPAIPIGAGARITAGADGNLWISDLDKQRAVRVTPGGVFTAVPLGDGVGIVTPKGLGVAPDGTLWFVEDAGNGFGRITAEPAPRYTDAAALQVPAAGTTSGPASRYPATITASGHRGTVTGVSVRLNGIHHAFGADLTVQLVGPRGQSALLMANATNRAGDLTTPRDVLGGEVITFRTGAPQAPRFLTSGVFSPVNGGGFAINFPPPAVAAPTGDLTVFNGTDPNGEWRLFVADDEPSFGTTGLIAGGWSLDIQTTGVDAPAPPAPPAPPAAADRTPPGLRLGRLPASVTLAALRRGLTIRVTPAEAATLRASLRVRARGVTRGRAFPIELGRATRVLRAGRATRLVLVPGARRLGARASAFTVLLELRATDAAGNRTTTRRTLRVSVPARR